MDVARRRPSAVARPYIVVHSSLTSLRFGYNSLAYSVLCFVACESAVGNVRSLVAAKRALMEGDDEDDDRSSASDCPVLLGFLSRVGSSARLLPHRFPSKVGGLPVWLEPAHLPDAAALACAYTGRPLKFLLQVRRPEIPVFAPLS